MSAPYRIRRRRTTVGKVSRGGAGEAYKEYLERVMRLIPAEVIGLYLIGSGFVPQDESIAHAAWLVFCLAAVFVVRIYGTTDRRTPRPQWGAIILSAAAYLVWVYSIGAEPFKDLGIYSPWLGSLLVLAASFLSPYLYQGDPE